MLLHAFGDPLLDAAFRVLDIAALGGAPDDGFERRAGREFEVQSRIKQVAVVRIADHQPVFAVIADEAFGNALDRFREPLLAAQPGLLRAAQGRDVIEPEQPLGAGDRNVAAGVSDLDIGDQQIEQFSALGLPDHLFVEQLAAACAQQLDDALPVREVVPEPLGVEQFQLILLVARQFAQPPVVEQQSPIFVDHAQAGRAVFEDFTELALLFGDLRLVLRLRGDVVDPEHSLAADEADVASLIRDLHVGQQQMHQLPALGPPNHLLIQQLSAALDAAPR